MPKKTGYSLVDAALARGDKEELSWLGKKGADSRKKKEFRLELKMLAEAREMAYQANEHLCPLND